MGLIQLKKELEKLDKAELIGLVADLYKKHKSVKELLDFYVAPNERELFNKYRDRVVEAFFPKRGFQYSIKAGKKAISDFKKLEPTVELIAELMLFYVETGIRFTKEFGDIDETFYSSMESTYADALKRIHQYRLLDTFASRAREIVRNANQTGWGFYDALSDIYTDYYDDDLEDTR